MKPEPKVYFALESLPEMIGDRQFKMLCEALGIDEAMREAKLFKSDQFNPGEFCALSIQRKSEASRQERLRQAERPLFEGVAE